MVFKMTMKNVKVDTRTLALTKEPVDKICFIGILQGCFCKQSFVMNIHY